MVIRTAFASGSVAKVLVLLARKAIKRLPGSFAQIKSESQSVPLYSSRFLLTIAVILKMGSGLYAIILGDRYRKLRFVSAFILFALIVLIGFIPDARAEIGNLISVIVLHSLGYAAISLLLVTGLPGALDEAVQTFLPYRWGRIDAGSLISARAQCPC